MVVALELAAGGFKWGQRAWQGYKTLKTCADKVQSFRRAPDMLRTTAALCQTLLEPMNVAEALAARHVALKIVGPALMFAHATIEKCNELVSEEPEDDDWQGWLATGTAGVTKAEQLRAVQEALTRASTALNLALTTVAVSNLGPRCAVSSFRYVRGAFEKAHDSFLQMEMGRERRIRLSGGELWQRGIRLKSGVDSTSDSMARLFDTRVSLVRGNPRDTDADDGSDDESDLDDDDGEGRKELASGGEALSDEMTLRFDSCEPAEQAEEDATSRTLLFDHLIRFRRVWSREIAAELSSADGDVFVDLVSEEAICYEFTPSMRTPASMVASTLVLVFRYGGGCSAEQFEALLWMARATRQADGPPIPLSSVYDAQDKTRLYRFVHEMQASVGSLDGPPQPPAAEKARRSNPSDLLSPMRSMAIPDTPSDKPSRPSRPSRA